MVFSRPRQGRSPGRARRAIRRRARRRHRRCGRHQLQALEEPGDISAGPQDGRDGRPRIQLLHLPSRLRADVFPGGMGHHQVTPRRHGRLQHLHQLVRAVLLRQEMEHRRQHHRDRLAQINHGPHIRVIQDARRVPQIPLDRPHPRTHAQQRPRMRHHHRVVIDIHHPGPRLQRLCYLMNMAGRRKSRADIDELPDARLDEKPDGADQETPFRPRRGPHTRHHGEQALSDLPVL
jgi:hypothetical protein